MTMTLWPDMHEAAQRIPRWGADSEDFMHKSDSQNCQIIMKYKAKKGVGKTSRAPPVAALGRRVAILGLCPGFVHPTIFAEARLVPPAGRQRHWHAANQQPANPEGKRGHKEG